MEDLTMKLGLLMEAAQSQQALAAAALQQLREHTGGLDAIVREENRLGHGCTIWNNSTVDYGCVIGDRVRIHCNIYIAQFDYMVSKLTRLA